MSPLIHLARVKTMLSDGCSVSHVVAETGAPELIVRRLRDALKHDKLKKKQALAHKAANPSKYAPYKEEIKQYIKDGLSFRQMANRLADRIPGVTRNAVLGYAHRNRLVGNASGEPRKPRPRAATMHPVKIGAAGRITQGDRLREIMRPDNVRDVKVDVPPHLRVPLQELTDKSCRWPAGDPRSPDFGFCGAQRVAGLPYCECHSRRAFQPPTSPGAQRTRKNSRHVEKTLADA